MAFFVCNSEVGESVGRYQYIETKQTVIQSTSMADCSFGFTEGSSLLLNGQKHLRSVVEDLISNK